MSSKPRGGSAGGFAGAAPRFLGAGRRAGPGAGRGAGAGSSALGGGAGAASGATAASARDGAGAGATAVGGGATTSGRLGSPPSPPDIHRLQPRPPATRTRPAPSNPRT